MVWGLGRTTQQMKGGLCREGVKGIAAALPQQMSFEGDLLVAATST